MKHLPLSSEIYPLAGAAEAYFLRHPEMDAANEKNPGNLWQPELTSTLRNAFHNVTDRGNRMPWEPEEQDHWSHDLPGDCENFALWKRKTLHDDYGIPLHYMNVMVGTVPRLGHHAVLVVETDEGDLILDNLNNLIMPWHQHLMKPLWITQPGCQKRLVIPPHDTVNTNMRVPL